MKVTGGTPTAAEEVTGVSKAGGGEQIWFQVFIGAVVEGSRLDGIDWR